MRIDISTYEDTETLRYSDSIDPYIFYDPTAFPFFLYMYYERINALNF